MYYSEQNMKDIQNGDRLNVTLEGKILGGGALGGIEFIDIDGSTKTKKFTRKILLFFFKQKFTFNKNTNDKFKK